jgi:hypothetical protein
MQSKQSAAVGTRTVVQILLQFDEVHAARLQLRASQRRFKNERVKAFQK